MSKNYATEFHSYAQKAVVSPHEWSMCWFEENVDRSQQTIDKYCPTTDFMLWSIAFVSWRRVVVWQILKRNTNNIQ